MADGDDTAAAETISALSLKNIPNLFTRMFNGSIAEDANPRGEVVWTALLFWIAGNSISAFNSNRGNRRLNLGPIYIW